MYYIYCTSRMNSFDHHRIASVQDKQILGPFIINPSFVMYHLVLNVEKDRLNLDRLIEHALNAR